MNKSNPENLKSTDNTQPSQIKKKQQRHLAIALCTLALVGWILYSFLSSHSTATQSHKRDAVTRMDMSNPITHVDESDVWMERTQNELNKTQKTTTDLQHQLQLLTDQKSAQEQLSQSQNESLQNLQMQIKELQQKLSTVNTSALNLTGRPANSNEQSNVVSPISVVTSPALKPIPGVSDDLLTLSPQKITSKSAPVIQPSKTPDTFVPAGTFVRAVMLGGADASAGVNSQGNPTPVLFRLVDSGTLPNHQHSHLKDCVATAAAIGDISSERGLMRLERLSCVSANHREVIEMPVEGTVFGPEGKNGVRGVPLWREGALLRRAFVAGSLSGFSQGIASQYTTTALSPTGAVSSVNNADIFKFGAAQGVSNAMDKLADYNIRRADQYHPVIQLSAGTVVDVVFLKGFYLDGQKHDNEKANILPPFETTAALLPSATPIPNSKANAANSENLPVNPLPLTSTQINALQLQNQNASFFKS